MARLALLLVLFTGCATRDTRAQAPGWKEQCTTFRWGDERKSVLVPVTLEGVSRWFQLDTGADVTMLYGRALAKANGWPVQTFENEYNIVTVSGSVGTAPFGPRAVFINDEMKPSADERKPAGTVGMDVLLNRVLVLDYEAARFCILDTLPPELERGTEFVPATLRRNRLFPEVTVGGTKRQDLFFDTGSSLAALFVDRNAWQEMTARTGEESDNTKLVGGAWGKETTLVGAPLRGALELASLHVESPIAYYRLDRPQLFREWGWTPPIAGALGNKPFFGRVVVLDAKKSAPRLGVRSSL